MVQRQSFGRTHWYHSEVLLEKSAVFSCLSTSLFSVLLLVHMLLVWDDDAECENHEDIVILHPELVMVF